MVDVNAKIARKSEINEDTILNIEVFGDGVEKSFPPVYLKRKNEVQRLTTNYSHSSKKKPSMRLSYNRDYELTEYDFNWLNRLNEKLDEMKITENLTADLLEKYLNVIEDASFFADANPPLQSDESWVCAICLMDHKDAEGTIIVCDRCDMAIHVECYGVGYVPNEDWLCERCRLCPSPKDPKSLQCQICPRMDPCAAMKQISLNSGSDQKTEENETGWVHSVCADAFPEVAASNYSNREPLDGLQRKQSAVRLFSKRRPDDRLSISKAQIKHKCDICQKSGDGACVKCSNEKCTVMFHPSCGQSVGCKMILSKGEQSGLSFLCPKHTLNKTAMSRRAKRFAEIVKGDVCGKPRSKLLVKLKEKSISEIRNCFCGEFHSKSSGFVFDRIMVYWSLKRERADGVPLGRTRARKSNMKRITNEGDSSVNNFYKIAGLIRCDQERQWKVYSSQFALYEQQYSCFYGCLKSCIERIELENKDLKQARVFARLKRQLATFEFLNFSEFQDALNATIEEFLLKEEVKNPEEVKGLCRKCLEIASHSLSEAARKSC